MSLWPIIQVSLIVSSYSTVVVMVLSTAFAVLVHKYPSKWLKAVELLIYIPMAMPPVALGYGLLLMLGPNSRLGGLFLHYFGVDIAFSTTGAIVAACSVSLGIGVRTMRMALESIDADHHWMAELMGASPRQIFFHITFPLCRPAFIGGAILVFVRSLGEFGATMVLAGNTLGQTRTLALAIWTDMQMPNRESECLLLVILCAVISLSALVVSEIFLRRSTR